MLKINKLTKYYNKNLAVNELSISVNKGEIFGFIGPNGAGKSTTIRCIMDLINRTSGQIIVDDKLVNRDNLFTDLKTDIGYLPSEIHLYDDLTVQEMLDYSASFYKNDCTKKTKELVKRLKIDLTKKCDELSLGNIKKVGIVLALMHNPKFIILDEPTSGLDPLMQEELYQILEEEVKEGKTIFFSTHVLSEIRRICSRIAVIKEGKIIKILDVDTLGEDFLVITLSSKEVAKIKKEIKLDIISEDNNTIKILNKEDINKFIKLISKYDIDKILIEEPSIQEIFMKYYE